MLTAINAWLLLFRQNIPSRYRSHELFAVMRERAAFHAAQVRCAIGAARRRGQQTAIYVMIYQAAHARQDAARLSYRRLLYRRLYDSDINMMRARLQARRKRNARFTNQERRRDTSDGASAIRDISVTLER